MKLENLSCGDYFRIENPIVIDKLKYAVVGNNGTGKTTLLRNLSGNIFPDKGIFCIDEKEILYPVIFWKKRNTQRMIQKNVLYIEDYHFIHEKWTLEQNVDYYLELGDFDKELLYDYLSRFQLTRLLKNSVGEFSLGTKQKVAICLLFSSRKKYLMVDEPTLGLDMDSKKKFIEIMDEASKKHIIIVSTNDGDIIDSFDKYIFFEENEVKLIDDNPYYKIAD